MAISDQVHSQLFQQPTAQSASAKAIRIPTTRGDGPRSGPVPSPKGSGRGLWTPEEHLRFLEALDRFPKGPWKNIANYVGTKTPRQAMTHGQKYRQKIARRRRGLKKIVRDLNFAAPDAGEEAATVSVIDAAPESNPVLSDDDFAAFVASLDLAQELELEYMSSPLNDSPLVVPAATAGIDMPSYSLNDPEAAEMMELSMEVVGEAALPMPTTQQDAHHWVVMERADESSEEFSAALAAAFHPTTEEMMLAAATSTPLPEQLLDDYEEKSAEPLPLGYGFDGVNPFQLDGFELR